MLFVKDTKARGTVFQVQKEEKYVDANFVTSEKVTDEQGNEFYKNSQWPARFVGNAFAKAQELTDKDRIMVTSYKMENIYVKEKNTSYLRMIVFEILSPAELKAVDEAKDAVKNTDPNA